MKKLILISMCVLFIPGIASAIFDSDNSSTDKEVMLARNYSYSRGGYHGGHDDGYYHGHHHWGCPPPPPF